MTFNYTKCDDCPRECEKFTYVRNVEYGKYHEPIYRTLKKFSLTTGSQGIDIAAFQVNLFGNLFMNFQKFILGLFSSTRNHQTYST